MPPRPFPQPLSIGTDICHYIRFLKYFPTTHQQHLVQNKTTTTTTAISSSQALLFKFFDKTLLPSEQRDFWRRFRGPSATFRRFAPGGSAGAGDVAISPQVHQWDEQRAQEAARHIGGRWAAKEAVIKAFSSQRRLMLRDVEIRRDAKTKQPLAVVLDETSNTKHQSAREVYASLVGRWELRERLAKLQREVAVEVAPGKGLHIIKEPSLSRHTARGLEYKQDLPQQEPTSEPATPAAAPASVPTPSILSEEGILDLSAVTKLLDQQQPASSSAPPTQEPQEAQHQNQDTVPQENPEEPQTSKRSHQLEEEMKRLRKEEQAEDAWNNLQGQIVKVSISHDGEYCVATALAAV
ncbi:hypothetical protein KCU71_g9278, partial [Aureobasidium melanogenum]